ncbi:hypothetical protein J6590_104325 [Homalodisca vitripennis]|nr:hypothetical protein J6590_104325 [Homalodisca vitripennis]
MPMHMTYIESLVAPSPSSTQRQKLHAAVFTILMCSWHSIGYSRLSFRACYYAVVRHKRRSQRDGTVNARPTAAICVRLLWVYMTMCGPPPLYTHTPAVNSRRIALTFRARTVLHLGFLFGIRDFPHLCRQHT